MDDKPNHRKLSWVSWNKMTLPRKSGGLGFIEIEQFNDAILVKLAWRILKHPHSLLAQTLAGKYFHSVPFLEATSPQSASHGWRGILAGKEVLLKVLGRVVGSGTSINFWTESWLTTDHPLKPIGPPTNENRNLCVSDLIDSQAEAWNIEAIRAHLPQYEAQIRTIPLSQFHMADELVWLPEKNGTYSTKTGYALYRINIGDPDLAFDWNKLVWGVKTSQKLKHFLWKIKNKAIPVNENLIRRGIEMDGQCKRCGVLETECHVFSQCPFAARVWDLLPTLYTPVLSTISTPAALLLACRRMVSLPPTGLHTADIYQWVLWYLWVARNKFAFENLMMSEQEVATLALREARIWQGAQSDLTSPTDAKKKVPPECGEIQSSQCFVDAAWNTTTRGGGFDCIFKDRAMQAFHQSSVNRCFVGSAFIAEALAVRTALVEAVNLGLRTLTVWSDLQSLITIISSRHRSVEAQGILFDIEHLRLYFTSISFCHVPTKQC